MGRLLELIIKGIKDLKELNQEDWLEVILKIIHEPEVPKEYTGPLKF